MQAPLVIIGAGLTGLSVAYHLEQQGFFDYIILDKEASPGGLCRSVSLEGFTFDYTGHLIHSSDAYFSKFIEHTIGFDALESINRRSFIYSHETYTHYPYQMNLFGLPNQVIEECISGFIHRKKNKPTSMFKDWVLSYFGKGIARHFFYPFQRKILSYPLKKVTSEWMGRFVPTTSLMHMLKGACMPPEQQSVGYNAHFFYPSKGGINAWMNAIASQLITPIKCNYKVRTIDTAAKRIIFENGDHQVYSTLVNTMPLPSLLGCLKESSTLHTSNAQSKLHCNSVLNFNLGIGRAQLTDKHWIYFPENKYPFYRIGFPHNFSSHSVPDGCSSVYGELSFMRSSLKRRATMLEQSYNYIQQLLGIKSEEILLKKVITIPYAYVIYDQWRSNNLSGLLNRLTEHQVHSIGRYGAWKYSSMQEAVLDGKTFAHTILSQRSSLLFVAPHQQQERTL